jgi:hypothetical protein
MFQKQIDLVLEKMIQSVRYDTDEYDKDLASLFRTYVVHSYLRSSPPLLPTNVETKKSSSCHRHRFVIAKNLSQKIQDEDYEIFQKWMEKALSKSERMNFILELRTDLRHWITEWKHQQRDSKEKEEQEDTEQQQQQISRMIQLEHHLQKTLKDIWAQPSSTRNVQRISFYETSAAVLELIEKKEAVHPVINLQDLRDNRLGPNKRVFGLFHDDLQLEIPLSFQLPPVHAPAVVVHTSLHTHIIPSHMAQVLTTTMRSSGDDEIQAQEHQQEQHLEKPNMDEPDDTHSTARANSIDATHPDPSHHHTYTVATFYSITNLHPGGLAGVGLGEYLLKQVIRLLQNEIPTLETFVTLSPIPGFRKWIQELHDNNNKHNHTTTTGDTFSTHRTTSWWNNQYSQDIAQNIFHCHPDQVLEHVLQMNYEQYHQNEGQLHKNHPSMRNWLIGLAARYLAMEKQNHHHPDGHNHHHHPRQRPPRNPVTRFHISNGAEMYRINYDADPSKRGFLNSFGIMVNYRYVLSDVEINQQNYQKHHQYTIPLHKNVTEILASQNFDE